MAATTKAVYGRPPPELANVPSGALQLSPLVPGSPSLEHAADGSLAEIVVQAPPGRLERRFVLAHALRAVAPGGELLILAPKDLGGSRLKSELTALGCEVAESARRHHRICLVRRPSGELPLADAIAAGAPRQVPALGAVSQPGVFSWDRPDPGTALLIKSLPPLAGAGADLGCGVGVLARAVLASPEVSRLFLFDIDRRAVDAAKANLADPRVSIDWADVRIPGVVPEGLDFVVMNPPFHEAGGESRALGQAFIRVAAGALRRGGTLWMVANRHLPYEAVLDPLFKTAQFRADAGGFKVIEARKG